MKTRLGTSAVLALAALIVAPWVADGGALAEPSLLQADPVTVFTDSDGDFLPDVVEWVVMTDATEADTDVDGVPDFVEVVQNGHPRQGGQPLASDHEMRVVVTSVNEATGPQVYLHLLFRFMGSPALLSSLDCYLSLGGFDGLRIPLNQLSVNLIELAQCATANEGLWVRVTVPVASENVLRSLMPFTIMADARIGTRTVQTGMPVFDQSGVMAAVVPFGNNLVAVQSLALAPPSVGSNRVCVMQLQQVGSSPAGAVCEVVDAECVDYNELQCGASCNDSVGRVFTLPGGSERVSGG